MGGFLKAASYGCGYLLGLLFGQVEVFLYSASKIQLKYKKIFHLYSLIALFVLVLIFAYISKYLSFGYFVGFGLITCFGHSLLVQNKVEIGSGHKK